MAWRMCGLEVDWSWSLSTRVDWMRVERVDGSLTCGLDMHSVMVETRDFSSYGCDWKRVDWKRVDWMRKGW